MKALKLLLIIAVLTWFSGLLFVGNKVYRKLQAGDPLKSERIEYETAKLNRLTEQERQKTEQERRETAVTLANLRRKERLENSQAVSAAAVVLAVFLRSFPVLLFGGASIGGLVFAYTRRVHLSTPQISGAFPRKDALIIARTALQVANAEAAARSLAFAENVSQERLKLDADVIRSLKTGREIVTGNQNALTAGNEQPPTNAGNISFSQAVRDFRQGEILLGYQDGKPAYLPFDNFVSAAVGGASGSGKTSKLRFLLSQLILQGFNVSILDAHQGNPKALVDSLGNLANMPNVRIFPAFETAAAVKTMLTEVQAGIDAGTPADVPFVYVLDELRPLNRRCADVEILMDILANEANKFRRFGLFSSQQWEAAMFGKSGSAARDACVFKAAAKMPKEQARTLFKDGETARIVSKLSQSELFAESMKFSGVVDVPFMSRSDCDALASKKHALTQAVNAGRAEISEPIEDTGTTDDAPEMNVERKASNVIAFPTMKRRETPTERAETVETHETATMLSDSAIRAEMAAKLETPGASLSGIAAEIGVNKGVLHRFIRNNENPSEATRARCMAFLHGFTAGTNDKSEKC